MMNMSNHANCVLESVKSEDDDWKGGDANANANAMMTLEDFLAKAGAVEDVKSPLNLSNVKAEEIEGRGKGIAMLEKAAQQRQRRMIKNRESAARSRERKQAYQAELESLALKLEQENHTLLKLKKEHTRKRYKQLMDNIIPVTEKQRPTKYVLRKVRSMEW
ncbi:hypothetical protein QVD17_19005 [Tagetes erecta]|uniref:BZIP domain-containing protein n=1 Tax=Tagetes erecta TaxID=13708 RepID=A0AAD8KIN8_TARER|nr:hypothetical protein QVD17_19005 [Tagetes erecta]